MPKQGKSGRGNKILSVKNVPGKAVNRNWKSPMQVINTDKGKFVDNQPGRQFGSFKSGSPGHDWSSEVGKTVQGAKEIVQGDNNWLNKSKK